VAITFEREIDRRGRRGREGKGERLKRK